MPKQLDLEAAFELQARGIASVLDGEDPEWKAAAADAIRTLAAGGRRFTSDDVLALVGEPIYPNALGAMFRWAQRAGVIRLVGYRPSRYARKRGRRIGEWEGAGGDDAAA